VVMHPVSHHHRWSPLDRTRRMRALGDEIDEAVSYTSLGHFLARWTARTRAVFQ